MSRLRLLSLLVLASVAFTGCNKEDPWMRMFRQKKHRPYSKSAVFLDGRAMRDPVAGTVAREARLDLDDTMPLVTAALLEKGKKRYDLVCATCHGLTGESDWAPTAVGPTGPTGPGLKSTGSIVATNFALNPAPSWHQDRLRAKEDLYFYSAIARGFGYMPAFTEIPQEERWAIVAYIRALQLSQRYPYERLSEPEKAEVTRAAGTREGALKKEPTL